MKYEEALQAWGLKQLNDHAYNIQAGEEVLPSTVVVGFEFDRGYACCGGRDEGCYCSFERSPSAAVYITGTMANGMEARHTMNIGDFDFATVLAEIVDAADGTVTK